MYNTGQTEGISVKAVAAERNCRICLLHFQNINSLLVGLVHTRLYATDSDVCIHLNIEMSNLQS
jgi:hypothetical protein